MHTHAHAHRKIISNGAEWEARTGCADVAQGMARRAYWPAACLCATGPFYPFSPLFSHPCSSPNYPHPFLSPPMVPPPRHPTVSLVLFYCPASHSESHTSKHIPPQSVRRPGEPLPSLLQWVSCPAQGVITLLRCPWGGSGQGPPFLWQITGVPCWWCASVLPQWGDKLLMGSPVMCLEIPGTGYVWGSPTHHCFSVLLCLQTPAFSHTS